MTKLDLATVGDLPTHPIFEGLPEALKDPACYADIEKRLSTIMYSDHAHKTVKGFVRCARCKGKLGRRKDALKELGFASYPQYLEWRKIMGIIIGQQNIQLT